MSARPTLEETAAPGSRPVGPDAAAPLLRVQDLHVEFRTRAGVVEPIRGLSFDLAPGETLAVLGESGSGKSVTAQAVMGLLPRPAGRISSGRVLFDGEDLAALPASAVRDLRGTEMAMVFQDPLSSLNPVYRIGTQIGEALRRRRGASRRAARQQAVELMRLVGIPDASKRADDYPHQFSGGMRQRAMIAMALALEPRLLVADEPTTALDVTVQAQIMRLLADLQSERDMALVLITHDLGVVADVADRVLVMYAGRAVETGGIRDVYDAPAHPYTEGLMASIPTLGGSRERLTPIPGSPPSLLAVPSGCAFRARCPYAVDACAERLPSLRVPEGCAPSHQAACLRTEEVLPR
ncbi:ABC transporter ATP-binding protein [Terrabacter sp. NPDC000476]|uniref:ABC transporter ATP-binding protein n=1 Tax=Terrabacter sp. NPDC000476 TaxID=3154258 RepID=UPI00332BCAA3